MRKETGCGTPGGKRGREWRCKKWLWGGDGYYKKDRGEIRVRRTVNHVDRWGEVGGENC